MNTQKSLEEKIAVKIDQAQAVTKALRDLFHEMEWEPERSHAPYLVDVISECLYEM